MAARTMTVSLLVNLRERASRGIEALRGRLERLSSMAGRLTRIGAAVGTIGVATAVLGAASFLGIVRQAAAVENQLRAVAIRAGHTGSAVEASILRQQVAYGRLAFQTGFASDQARESMLSLLRAGMPEAMAQQYLPTVLRGMRAMDVEMSKVVDATVSMQRNMGLSAQQIEGVFGRFISAAQRGRMELSGMIGDVPKLAEALGQLGIRAPDAMGRVSAAMTAARRVTATDDEARSSVMSLIQGSAGPDATKRFRDAGIDLPRLMRNADRANIPRIDALLQKITSYVGLTPQSIERIRTRAIAQGLTPEQAVQEVVRQLSAGRVGERLEKLLGGKDGLAALVGIMSNLRRYNEETAADNANGSAAFAQAYADRMRSAEVTFQRLSGLLSDFRKRVGLGFASFLEPALPYMDRLLAWVMRLDQSMPGIVDKAIAVAAGFFGLVGAAAALGVVMPAVTAGLGILAGALAAILSPIGLVVGGLALAAAAIIANWTAFAAAFSQIWGGIKQVVAGATAWIVGTLTGDFGLAAEGVRAAMTGIGNIVEGGWGVIRGFFDAGVGAVRATLSQLDTWLGTDMRGAFDRFAAGAKAAMSSAATAVASYVSASLAHLGALPAGLARVVAQVSQDFAPGIIRAIESASSAFGEFVSTSLARLGELPAGMTRMVGEIVAALQSLPGQLVEIGTRAIQGLWDGMIKKFDELMAWVGSLPGRIRSVFSGLGSAFGSGSITPGQAPAPGVAPAPGATPQSTPAPQVIPGGGFRPINYNPDGDRGFAPVTRAASAETRVGGSIHVTVDSPGRVTGMTSTNERVPISASRGPVLDRA